MTDFASFVLAHLPPPPVRVLEVGCGTGELALALAARGHDVVAIDPEAPSGPLFRQVRLEDYREPGLFDAVVASRSLHHHEDLAAALQKIAALLRPGALVVVDEFAWDRLDLATAKWYHDLLRRAVAAGRRDVALHSLGECIGDWEEEHRGLHGYDDLRRELDRRFLERSFSWEPYLYRYLEGVTTHARERRLIEAGAIRPLGFRYVGEKR